MNKDEKLAYQFLKYSGFKNIIHEPDGNIPPDFLCDLKIAVEVRRLNQHIDYNNNQKPIEELNFRLIPRINELFKSLNKDFKGNSIAVSIRFKRPLSVNSKLVSSVKSILYKNIPFEGKTKIIDINPNLQFKLYNSTQKLSKSIMVGSIHDMDGGGSIVSIIQENLKLVLAEKERKVKPFLKKYKSWWLILCNHIWDNLDVLDIRQINDFPSFETFFDRIILISPYDFRNSIEINIVKACA
jgi:hypothetical protein